VAADGRMGGGEGGVWRERKSTCARTRVHPTTNMRVRMATGAPPHPSIYNGIGDLRGRPRYVARPGQLGPPLAPIAVASFDQFKYKVLWRYITV
jgi:hypothetical protein